MSLHQFLGLKHKLGADPKNGEGADCLLLCFTLLDEAGIHRAEFNPEWLKMAEAGQWLQLERIWNTITRPVSEPVTGSVALHWNKPSKTHPRLGVSTVVENNGTLGIVMIHGRKGVVWLPLATPGLPSFNFREFV